MTRQFKRLTARTRWITGLAVGAVLAPALAGCGASTSTGSKVVTITLSGWTSSPVEATLMKKELAGFSKSHPNIHVKYRPISGNYATILKTRLVAGDAPDVIYVNNGGESSSFIKNGDIISLNKYIQSSHFSLSAFYPSSLSLFQAGGKTYGIPKDQSPLALFYNKTLFKAAGITSPPTTWAEFQTDARLLTKASQHQYGLINSVAEPRWAEFLYQAGGSVMNASMTHMTLTTPQAERGYAFFVNLYRKGYAALPTAVGASWGGQAFGMGKAGMVLSGNWLVPFLNQTYPKTSYGIAPLPSGPVNNLSLTFPVAYSITRDSKHPNASWQLIQYLTGVPGMTKWMNLGLALPVRPALLSLPYYTQHPVLKGLLEQLPHTVAWNFPPGFSQYSSTTMTDQTTLAIEGKESASQALANMQKDGEAILHAGG